MHGCASLQSLQSSGRSLTGISNAPLHERSVIAEKTHVILVIDLLRLVLGKALPTSDSTQFQVASD